VRGLANAIAFYTFLIQFLKKQQKKHIAAFLASAPYNPTFLGSSIRHVFAHGTLTANPGGVNSNDVLPITEAVNDFHFRIMDSDFARRIP
jgi:hypothetical protein